MVYPCSDKAGALLEVVVGEGPGGWGISRQEDEKALQQAWETWVCSVVVAGGSQVWGFLVSVQGGTSSWGCWDYSSPSPPEEED